MTKKKTNLYKTHHRSPIIHQYYLQAIIDIKRADEENELPVSTPGYSDFNDYDRLSHIVSDINNLLTIDNNIDKDNINSLPSMAGEIAGELLSNSVCRISFERNCQAFHNGYRAFYDGYKSATKQERDLFLLIIEGGATKEDEQSLARDYVLLAGIHDWMLWNSYAPIYAMIWPDFLRQVTGLIIVALQDNTGLLKAAYLRVKNDLSKFLADDKGTKKDQSTTKKSRKSKRQKTPAQLLKETRESQAKKYLKDNPDATVKNLGGHLGCDPSTACRTKAWIKHQEHKKGRTRNTPNGFKRDRREDGPDTEAITNGPQEEHYDVKDMIDAYKSGKLKTKPTAQIITDKLSLKNEADALRLLEETLHFFPEIAENT